MAASPATLAELKQRLAQLDALIQDGTLTGAAARQARDELERQVLAWVVAPPAPGHAASAAWGPRPSRRLLIGALLFVGLAGGGGYALLASHAGWGVGP
ncbi:MAG: hypothetical protein KGL50_03230, partial [Burkholderiales bacterium]|nr:hypothetical protein [Burkholderiales bacterium]